MGKIKNVLFLVQNLPLPQDRRVFQEMETLAAAGYGILAIAPGNPDQPRFEEIGEMRIWRYPKPRKSEGVFGYLSEYAYSLLASFYLAITIYLKEGYQAIHISNPPDFFFLIGGFMKLFGVRYVFDQHDLMPEMAEAKFQAKPDSTIRKMLLLCEKLAMKLCDLHVTTCESGQDLVRKRNTFRAETFIVRNAVDFGKVRSDTLPKSQLASVSGFEHVCAYLGVMGFQDGLDKLLESISYVVNDKDRKDIGFVLMGDGDALESIKQAAVDYGISDRIAFTGWADSETISTYLNLSDLGLMPEPKNGYTDNSLHNKVMEYMAHGLPVVSYDLKEARRSAGEAGVFVSDDDPIRFAQAVIELVDDEDKRKSMSELARKTAREKFGWERSGKKLLEAYRSLEKES